MRRRLVAGLLAFAAVAGFALFVVPQFAGLHGTLARLRSGNPWWLGVGVFMEAVSLGAYAAVFHDVFSSGQARVGWRESFQITLASDVATKLLATAGAGGIALTVWALRAAGLGAADVARRIVALNVLLYGVYMSALVVGGVGLGLGVLSGPAPPALTIVPAALGAAAIAVALSSLRLADAAQRWMQRRASRASTTAAPRWRRAAGVPRALRDGLRTARDIASRRHGAPLAAAAYWGFDIAALWASFHAFGHAPPGGVLVVGYFVGTLANVLPLPGGIGGVEGGMIAAFLGFGVDGGLAVLAVLAYRTISYWLPTLPGLVAYLRLRGTVARWRAAPPLTAAEAARAA